jgi:Ca2+-binding RTX toxin-like protein
MPISGLPTTIGNDTVTVTPTGLYSVDGLAGVDTLVVNYSTLTTSIDFRYIANGYYGFRDDFNSGIDFINFERFIIRGGSGDDKLQGGNDVDQLYGGAGADILTSGLGADTVNGGAGYDRWVANYGTLNINVTATLLASGTASIGGSGASVTAIEAAELTTGSGNDILDTTAVTGNDAFSSGLGDDQFRTAGGIDSFNGDIGNDRLVVNYADATTPVTHHYVASGWWAVGDQAGTQSVTYINVESLDLTGGSSSDKLSGAGANDRLVGNAGDDWLNGGAGVDVIDGGDGTDTWIVDYSARAGALVNLMTQTTNTGAVISGIEAINYTGTAGIDNITANAGVFNDVFFTAGGNDIIVSGRGVDSVNGDLGIDKLIMDWSAIADPLHGISNFYVANGWYAYSSLSGDRLDYINIDRFDLTGGAGADALNGGASYDWLRGNAGNDTFNSGTGDMLIDGGTGNDRLIANLADEVRSVRIDAALSQTTSQGTVAGNDIRNIEALSISTGVAADVLSTAGMALDDSFNLGGGNDSVSTGLGFDAVNGEAGIDYLTINYSTLTTDITSSYVANGWYRYGDAAGTAHVDYINVERFSISGGSGNDGLSGAEYDDRLYGNAGNDVLNGYRGNDLISGGTGNDTWIADYGNATANLSLALNAAGTGTLAGIGSTISSIENVTLTTGAGDDIVNLTLSLGNDNIATGGGTDLVDVGAGRFETADGGLGADALTADMALSTGGITVEYYANGWWHAISAAGDYELRFINFETLDFTGSSRNDRLVGFGGADSLSGGGGNDILNGGAGNDVLTGGAAADQFYFGDVWSNGIDTITDATSGDFIRLAGITLAGNVTAGNGSTLGAGQVQVETAGGVSTLHVGVDGTAGADFHVQLNGTFAAGGFQLSGGDIIII